MPSIQEIIGVVSSIKSTSEQLSTMVASANVNLANQSSAITQIVMGSTTGQEAVNALSIAVRSLSEAAASMKTLSRTCDDCIANLSK